jgi:hypothetical protein
MDSERPVKGIEVRPAYDSGSGEYVNGEKLLVIGNGGLWERVHVPVEIANEITRLQQENADLHQLADHYRQLYLELESTLEHWNITREATQ